MPEAAADDPKPEPPSDSPPAESSEAEQPGAVLDRPIPRGLPRVVSIIVLLAVVLLIGVLFFRVMATFLVPLFLAAVLTVVCEPLHKWALGRFNNRKQLAALVTTTLISLIVLVPTAVLGWMAYVETNRVVGIALAGDDSPEAAAVGALPAVPRDGETPTPVQPEAEGEAGTEGDEQPVGWTDQVALWVKPLTDWYRNNVNADFDPAKLARDGARYAVQLGLVGVQTLFGFLFGMAIMIFALYYFLADGPSIIETLMHLSPLDDDYERELLTRFAQVSRAVMLATVLSAVVQGLLAGVGYYFVLDGWTPDSVAQQFEGAEELIQPPLFLLTVLTMLLAIVPFIGAAGVWVPVVAWVYFVQGDAWAAIGMGIYGAAVVSSIDNFIKPYVLHGQSNLHPLLALLSVLGGLQLLGPIGILVGPMLVAFMQALLEMLRKELDGLRADSHETPVPASSA